MFRFNHLSWISCLLLMSSCSNSPTQNEVQTLSYFDIKGYFEGEVAKLDNENPVVYKEVIKNTQSEAKKVSINDWNKELSLFIESDINKPSWRNSYSSEKSNDTVVYKALSDDLRTREVRVVSTGDKVHSIFIENSAANELYESNEKLSYFPDSLYRIVKKQQVRIIGANNYEIVGKLKKAN